MIGVINPESTATAIAISASRKRWIVPDSASYWAFTFGDRTSAAAAALMTRSLTDSFTPGSFALISERIANIGSMQTSTEMRKCGACCFEA